MYTVLACKYVQTSWKSKTQNRLSRLSAAERFVLQNTASWGQAVADLSSANLYSEFVFVCHENQRALSLSSANLCSEFFFFCHGNQKPKTKKKYCDWLEEEKIGQKKPQTSWGQAVPDLCLQPICIPIFQLFLCHGNQKTKTKKKCELLKKLFVNKILQQVWDKQKQICLQPICVSSFCPFAFYIEFMETPTKPVTKQCRELPSYLFEQKTLWAEADLSPANLCSKFLSFCLKSKLYM